MNTNAKPESKEEELTEKKSRKKGSTPALEPDEYSDFLWFCFWVKSLENPPRARKKK